MTGGAAAVAAVAATLAAIPVPTHLAAAQTLADQVRRSIPRRTGRAAGSVQASADAAGGTVLVGVPYARKLNARSGYMDAAATAAALQVAQVYADAIAGAARKG